VPADIDRLREHVRRELSIGRYLHSLRTAEMTTALVRRFAVSPEEARIAGLAHDMARELTESEIVKLAESDGIPLLEEEERHPILLHGRAAAVMLQELWGEHREDVLAAVRWHTQGDVDMGLLGMLLFVADYIEPGRTHVSDQFRYRIMKMERAEEMTLAVINDQLSYLTGSGMEVSERTKRLAAYIREGTYAVIKTG